MNKWLFAKIADQVVKGVNTTRTAVNNLNRKTFNDNGHRIVAIEQNPNTRSEWAQMSREGKKVVQFKDMDTNQYVGVSVDGKVTEYK